MNHPEPSAQFGQFLKQQAEEAVPLTRSACWALGVVARRMAKRFEPPHVTAQGAFARLDTAKLPHDCNHVADALAGSEAPG